MEAYENIFKRLHYNANKKLGVVSPLYENEGIKAIQHLGCSTNLIEVG